MQNSFLNSHQKQSEAAAAAKQFFNQKSIPAALACSKKTNDRFSFKTLFSDKATISSKSFIIFTSSCHLSFLR